MKSIFTAVGVTLLLAGCSSNKNAFPTVSDSDIKRYIVESNKVEQCLYPQITHLNGNKQAIERFYESLSINETAYLHSASEAILKDIIGSNMAKRLDTDSRVKAHFEQRFEQLNHSNPVKIDAQACLQTKAEQRTFLNQYGRDLK